MDIKRICVIGAGISGLVTAKTFAEAGYEVTVFEKQKGLGGVWEASRSYPGLTTQSTRDTYAFSDYPMPKSYPEWPTAEQMRNYLESYARHFGIAEKIHFQTEVTSVEKKSNELRRWIVKVKLQKGIENIKQEKYEFDYVLVCNGTFSIPRMPLLIESEKFLATGGKILHSSEFNDISILHGKRVAIVGFGKSATDIASITATKAKECTLIFRRPLWKAPRFFFGLVNVKYILLTRFSEAWFKHRHLQGFEKILHTIGKPIVKGFWRTNEWFLRLQFSLDALGMLPSQPLDKLVGCGSGAAIIADEFYKHVCDNKIITKQTSISRFLANGLELSNGDCVQADIVIFATGFKQCIPFIEEKYRRLIIDNQGYFHLYRSLIYPEIPNMGFVGYNSSLFCQLTSEVSAWWLLEYVKGNLILPKPEQMYKEINDDLRWREENGWTTRQNSNTCVAPFSLHYIEQLMQDMGIQRQSNLWQRITDIMLPVNPSTYMRLRQKSLLDKKLFSVE